MFEYDVKDNEEFGCISLKQKNIPARINVIKIREMDNLSLVNYLLCLVLTDTCMAIWGASELFNKSCKPIVSSDLWLYGYVTFIIQTTMLSIIGVLCICTFLLNIIRDITKGYQLKKILLQRDMVKIFFLFGLGR